MDLSRILLIQESPKEKLNDPTFLEELIISLGFNTEILHEQPEIVRQNGGGLLIWQYPNQFSKYLCFLQRFNIKSYMEIGCRWGGTYILTTEFLKRFQPLEKSIAIDVIDSPVITYCMQNKETQFLKMNSQSNEFKEFIKQQQIDLMFIDGDHSYEGVKNDYEITKDVSNIFVFHDIASYAMCPGVVQFWNELKRDKNTMYDFYEFTEQYEDVWNLTHMSFLGIGVAVKKGFA